MAQKLSNRKRSKNLIQNVRIVDRDEGTDDLVIQRLLQQYVQSEGQIRVVCGFRFEVTPGTTVNSGIVSFAELLATDDFTSFAAQYQEYRVRGIRFDVYDINPNSSVAINYWSTFHQVGGPVPIGIEDILDRPDARSLSPGDGRQSLAWAAHGIPEMQFNSVGSNPGLGGLSYYVSPQAAIAAAKYQIVAKYIVDFRGRR